MADMKAYQELAGRQSLLEPAPVTSPTNATAKFLAERYAVGDAPTPSGFYGHYATDPNNAVVQRGILTPGAKYSDGKIHPAWPSFIHDAWEGYKAFADADPRDNSPEATDRLAKASFDVAGLAMTGGLAAPRPANSIGMFGGRLAKTADQAALAEAEKMAASGADRQAIWDATGWFQGPDKKWRWEIDDSAQKMLRTTDELAKRNPMPTDMVFAHPELYSAYPKVAEAPWYLTKELEKGGGSFDPVRGIRVGDGPGYASGKSGPGGITLHEQQHAVQGIEGFGQGGNREIGHPRADVERMAKEAYEANQARSNKPPTEDDLLLAELGIASPDVSKPWADLTPRQQMEWWEAGRGRAYHHLAGEVEARTVQKRMDLTPEERRARPPWLDYDVPESQQIVRFNEGKSGSSASMAPGGDGAFTLPPPRLEPRPMDTARLREIATAQYSTPYALDPMQNVPLSSLKGAHFGAGKVAPLADEIRANGWIEPLVVDRAGNVIEGQHRLRALQQLGVQDVPVHRIREILPDDAASAIQSAAKGAGIHREQAAALTREIAEIIDKEGVGELGLYDPPRGFEKAWAAAVAEAQKRLAPPNGERISGKADSQGSLNQSTADFLKERYGSEDYSPLRGYHWTPKPDAVLDDGRFLPFSHFGSTEAAAGRYQNQILENRHVDPAAVGHGGTIPVDIRMDNPLRINDFWKHDPETTASLIDMALAGKDPHKHISSSELLQNNGPLQQAVLDAIEKQASPRDVMSKHLSSRGHDGLVYENKYEGGGDSYIATQPGTVYSSTTGDLLYSNPKESAAIPLWAKEKEKKKKD